MAESTSEEVIAPWHQSVLLPSSILQNPSPTVQSGISSDVEVYHRAWGCTLICECGVLLKLPQVVVATSQNLLHRFYWRKSLADPRFDAFTISMACLLLGTKIEEKPRKLRQILYVFHHIYRKRKFHREISSHIPAGGNGERSAKDSRRSPLVLGGERYTQWKEKLISSERHILKELGFGFYQVMEHPHKYILYYIKYLSQHGMDADDAKLRQLAQHSWSYLNDSLRLDLCCRHESKNIACAATLIASRLPDVALALPSPDWIQALGADPVLVHEIVQEILKAYSLPVEPWYEPLSEKCHLSHKQQKKHDDVEEGLVVKKVEVAKESAQTPPPDLTPRLASSSSAATATTTTTVVKGTTEQLPSESAVSSSNTQSSGQKELADGKVVENQSDVSLHSEEKANEEKKRSLSKDRGDDRRDDRRRDRRDDNYDSRRDDRYDDRRYRGGGKGKGYGRSRDYDRRRRSRSRSYDRKKSRK